MRFGRVADQTPRRGPGGGVITISFTTYNIVASRPKARLYFLGQTNLLQPIYKDALIAYGTYG